MPTIALSDLKPFDFICGPVLVFLINDSTLSTTARKSVSEDLLGSGSPAREPACGHFEVVPPIDQADDTPVRAIPPYSQCNIPVSVEFVEARTIVVAHSIGQTPIRKINHDVAPACSCMNDSGVAAGYLLFLFTIRSFSFRFVDHGTSSISCLDAPDTV